MTDHERTSEHKNLDQDRHTRNICWLLIFLNGKREIPPRVRQNDRLHHRYSDSSSLCSMRSRSLGSKNRSFGTLLPPAKRHREVHRPEELKLISFEGGPNHALHCNPRSPRREERIRRRDTFARISRKLVERKLGIALDGPSNLPRLESNRAGERRRGARAWRRIDRVDGRASDDMETRALSCRSARTDVESRESRLQETGTDSRAELSWPSSHVPWP